METIGEYKPQKGEFPPGVSIRFLISENSKGVKSLVVRQGDQEVKLPMTVVDDLQRCLHLILENREEWYSTQSR